MGTFPEAKARLLDNMFVCKKCKTKIRATTLRVLKGEVRCRNTTCRSQALRPMRKK